MEDRTFDSIRSRLKTVKKNAQRVQDQKIRRNIERAINDAMADIENVDCNFKELVRRVNEAEGLLESLTAPTGD